MTTPSDMRRRDYAESRLPAARLTLIRIWSVVGAIVIAAAVLNVLGILAPVIEFLAVGSLIAFIEAPIVNFLEHHGVPRGLGALIGLVVVVAALVCIIMVITPAFVSQCAEILTRMPAQLRALGSFITEQLQRIKAFSKSSWATNLDSVFASLASMAQTYGGQLAGDLGKGMFPFISSLASQLFVIFLGLVLAYWLACDYPRIHREISLLMGEDKEDDYRFMVAIFSRAVGGYMRGMVITSVVDGVVSFIGFAIVGHPYAMLMGVMTGVLHLVPVVGPWVSAAFATLIALFADPFMALCTLIIAVIVQNVVDNVLSPKVMQSAVQVHPAMSLMAIVIGSALMGPLGMVVAIPLCAALKGLFIYYFETDTKRQLVSYDGAFFRGTPFVDEAGSPVAAYDALGDDSFVFDSEIIENEAAPSAQAMPKPELDNPWSALGILQGGSSKPGQTGVFKIPFIGDAPKDDASGADDEDDDLLG